MKILVTGGAGFIGSHLCKALLEKGHIVICVDNFNDYYSPEIKKSNISGFLKNKNFFLEKADIRNYNAMSKIFKKYSIKKIAHLAARAGVRPSLKNPKLYFDVNVNGTLNLLELSRIYKVKTFILASSSSVYGNNKKTPFSESDPAEEQISPYALTKKINELMCKSYTRYGINCTCLRFFTVYGPNGRPDMAPLKFTRLIYSGKPIEMYGDGSSARDYTYVDDIVQGIISALEKSYKYEIFNLGNSNPVKLREFISLIEKALNKKAAIIQKPMPEGDVKITYADLSKSKKMLGYVPKTKIGQGIKKLAEWYIKNRKLYENL